jgi:hypothetical protein
VNTAKRWWSLLGIRVQRAGAVIDDGEWIKHVRGRVHASAHNVQLAPVSTFFVVAAHFAACDDDVFIREDGSVAGTLHVELVCQPLQVTPSSKLLPTYIYDGLRERQKNILIEAGGRHTSLKKLKGLPSHGLGTLNLRVYSPSHSLPFVKEKTSVVAAIAHDYYQYS